MSGGKRFLKDHSRLYNLVSFRISLLQRKSRPKKSHAERKPDYEDLRGMPGFEVTVALVRAMDALAREHGARFALMYAHPGDPLAYAAAAELSERAGVAWLDLVPALRDRPERTLTFVYNRHWTAEGHRAVAEALYASAPIVALLEEPEPLVSVPPDADPAAAPAPVPQ
jgi:hypothetical protein